MLRPSRILAVLALILPCLAAPLRAETGPQTPPAAPAKPAAPASTPAPTAQPSARTFLLPGPPAQLDPDQRRTYQSIQARYVTELALLAARRREAQARVQALFLDPMSEDRKVQSALKAVVRAQARFVARYGDMLLEMRSHGLPPAYLPQTPMLGSD